MDNIPLTTGEIAQHCHVTHRAVLKWIASGKLKAYRTPGNHSRVSRKDFIDFLKAYQMPVPAAFASNGTKKKILIVDDDKEMAHALQRSLAKEGRFDLDVAYDGFEAGKKFAEMAPDLIILDLKMPGVNGHELCTHIRTDPKNQGVKIISMSGTIHQQEIDHILSLGADEHLSKPFTQQDLDAKIRKVFHWDRRADDGGSHEEGT